jgi:hypothetical protein
MKREATDMACTNGSSGRWWALSLALVFALTGLSGFDGSQADAFTFNRGPHTAVSSDESEVEVEPRLSRGLTSADPYLCWPGWSRTPARSGLLPQASSAPVHRAW